MYEHKFKNGDKVWVHNSFFAIYSCVATHNIKWWQWWDVQCVGTENITWQIDNVGKIDVGLSFMVSFLETKNTN